MNLLAAKLYDPATAASKATSSLLAMTAIDTTNLRLAVTVPAHGMVYFKMRCALTGATTLPTILLGVLNGATVVGRVTPSDFPGTMNAATQTTECLAEFVAAGLTPGAANFDAAYAVQVIVASTSIKYGGPNNASGANAWGAFCFEAWDPQPLATAAQLAIDSSGRVTAASVAGSVGSVTGSVGSVTGAVGSVTGNVGGNVIGSVASVTAAVTLPTIPSSWITAAGIATAALNGKGDWNIGKTGYSLATDVLDELLVSHVVAGSAGAALANLDAAVSTRLAASSYTAPDNTRPANFTALAITVGGAVTAGTVSDKTGYGLAVAPLDAAGTRAALGLAAANLDTQLMPVASVAAIKAKTDSLNFTVAGKLDVNVLVINGTTVAGVGTAGSPWGPA